MWSSVTEVQNRIEMNYVCFMNGINSFDANDLSNIKLDGNCIVRNTQDVTSAFTLNNEEKQDTSQ